MKSVAVAAFIAGALLVAVLVLHAGIPVLLQALAALGVGGLAVITGIHAFIVVLLGMAWWSIAHRAERPPLLRFVWARAVRDGAAEALPFSQVGGYVIGARTLVLAGATPTAAATSTLLDLGVEFAAKLPYLLAGLAFLAILKPQLAVQCTITAAAISAILVLVALQAKPSGRLAQAFSRALNRWPRLAELRGRTAAAMEQMISQRAGVARGFALHLLCWILGTGETWIALWLMHRPIGLAQALVIDSLVGALRAVSFFVPGALGVQEGGYVLLCGLFGVAPGAALAFSLARRARDLLLAILVLPSWQWAEGRALPSRFKS